MYKICSYFIVALFLLMWTSDAEQEWDYTLQSLDCNTTNGKVIDASLRAIRVSHGIYGIRGTLDIEKDLDNTYSAEVQVLRSPKGDSQYTMSPFQIPKSALNQFMNTHYKKLVMPGFKECCDLPVFETYIGPFPAKKYVLNNCIIQTDAMPTHLPLGWYKLTLKVSGIDGVMVCQLIANAFKKT